MPHAIERFAPALPHLMQLKTLAPAISPCQVIGPLDRVVEGIAYDSRRVQRNFLFVALRGEKSDGHQFIEQAIENVAMIHPQIREEFETGASHMWHDDPYAGGAFALFDPGQQTLLHDEIVKPEGRIHFAGEHASLYHAWIQGAFESGLRAAIAIHQSP